MYPFGTIALCRFPFTDLSGEKRRPAPVVSRDNDRRADLVVCVVTAVPRAGPDVARLAATPETGLKVPSVVRFDKLATLEPGVIAGPLGEAPPGWLDAQAATFFGVFGFRATP